MARLSGGRLAPGACALLMIGVVGCGGSPDPRPVKDRTAAATASPTPSFSDLVASVRGGVIRIESDLCDGQGVGTGFLLSPRLILTVQHVVDGATAVHLKQSTHSAVAGTVIGEDRERDIALIRSAKPLKGHVFALASSRARLGDGVAALGFPLGLPLTVTRGSISGTGRTIPIDGMKRRGLIQTDAAVNPGNSGGPLLRADTGEVVGLVDLGSETANGLAFAVSAQIAGALAEAWKQAPQPAAVASCGVGDPALLADGGSADPASAPAETPAMATYDGHAFSIDYPDTWSVSFAEEKRPYGTDTTIESAADAQTFLRVDVTPGQADVDSFAAPVLRALRRDPTYTELSLSHEPFVGYDALAWEFTVREHGRLLRKQDKLFIDHAGNGVAILAQAPEADFDRLASSFAASLDSFVSL
jgi:hypothetical protein